MLEKIKKYLRIINSEYDEEITDLIEACKKDLKTSGILESRIIDTDTLIMRAVSIYCKANFGFDNPDFDKFNQSYELVKAHLAFSEDYNTEGSE